MHRYIHIYERSFWTCFPSATLQVSTLNKPPLGDGGLFKGQFSKVLGVKRALLCRKLPNPGNFPAVRTLSGLTATPLLSETGTDKPVRSRSQVWPCSGPGFSHFQVKGIQVVSFSLGPHGVVRPFHQTSTCLSQSTLGPNVVHIWSRYVQNFEPS